MSLVDDLLTFKKQKKVSKKLEQVNENINWKVRAKVYEILIQRYADFINKSEIKTIPELKSLVNPSDEAIESVKNSIKSDNDEDFVRKAFDFVKKIELVELDSDVSFWLSPKEILEINASDSFDKAIFLCSLLKSKGLKAKIRVLEFSDSSRRPIVISEVNGKILTADPTEGILEDKNPEDFAKNLKIDGSVFIKALFEFDDKNYEDFQQ
jgi:hypothetical protein